MFGKKRANSKLAKNMDQELMTPEETHDFGIEVVAEYMRKDGYTDIKICSLLNVDPQIRACKDGQTVNVMVRTDMYPHHGRLTMRDSVKKSMDHAIKSGELCYFASVGLYNAKSETEADASIPVRGAGFYVAYEGLRNLIPRQ